jgi:pimeloyl-ACP methyl ester carboxylesterase
VRYLDVRSRTAAGSTTIRTSGVGGDGTVRLVEDWWRKEEGAPLFTGEVADYVKRVERRPSSLATLTDPQTAAAWETIPTTVLIGRDDSVSESDVRWALKNLSDVRFIESDHFIIFRHPRSVADLVLESFV